MFSYFDDKKEKIIIEKKLEESLKGLAPHFLLSKKEVCGFFIGKKNKYERIFVARNKDKDPVNNFKIGIIDKIRMIVFMIINKNDSYITFHTHRSNTKMSERDVKYSLPDSIQCIVKYPILTFYKIKKENKKKVPKIISIKICGVDSENKPGKI
jgi:proteasome lid subunit RPN8/RPN11